MAERVFEKMRHSDDGYAKAVMRAERSVTASAARLAHNLDNASASGERAARSMNGAGVGLSDAGRSVGAVAKGLEGLGSFFNSTLAKGMKRLDVDYSALVDRYVEGLGMAAASGAVLAGPDRQSAAGASRYSAGLHASVSGEAKWGGRLLEDKKRLIDAQSAMDEKHAERFMALEERKWGFTLRTAGQAAGAMANTLQNLYVYTGRKQRTMFEAMKAFAIAETLIQTYRAAQGAYAAMAKIHPVLGIAAAAAATVAGMARVSTIRNIKPDGATGTIGADGRANPEYGGGSPSAYPAPQRLSDADAREAQSVTVHIYNPLSEQNWQRIVEDNIIPAINSAGDRNIHLTVKNM